MEHIIKDYLVANGMSGVHFCKKVGISESYLRLIYHRDRYPSRQLCQRIYHFTGGKIHPVQLLEVGEIGNSNKSVVRKAIVSKCRKSTPSCHETAIPKEKGGSDD